MKRTFYKLSLSTLVAVYLLILVGGVVRSSGAGMGCPDWPKCFGSWVPPTDVTQLPADYKDFYANYRHEKNVKFAKYLSALGMSETAEELMSDKSVLIEADFNVVKTWTEYINRLVGVVIGLLIFAVFAYSVRFRKSDTPLFIIALLTFILVGFQGWIGSVVVSTNLTPWTVTLHMLLAIVIVGLLAYLVHKSAESSLNIEPVSGLVPWLLGCILVLLVQILLGTQVREAIDKVASMTSVRENWLSKVGLPFIIHRTFSWAVLALHMILLLKLRRTMANGYSMTLFALVIVTVLTGAGMAYFDVPPFLQPVHLLLATVTIGIQFLFLLRAREWKLEISKV